MNRKMILTLILALGVVVIVSISILTYSTSARSGEEVKVMAYTPPTITGESGYQIDKYENIENNQWLDENQVLTLARKDDSENADQKTSVRYCSIYNLNTNESKDFRDVNIDDFFGVSTDNKYVMYAEPRVIPNYGTDEWKKADESGDLFHRNVKLLNLSTGEITDVNTEKSNCSAEFKWVGNNKILANYSKHWAITDTSGKVYANGKYQGDENTQIAGIDDIKDLGDSVEGKFYYTQDVNGENGERIATRMCVIDIKSNDMKIIGLSKGSLFGSKKGKTIVMGYYNDDSKVFTDESGKVIQSTDLVQGKVQSDYILSPDGSKAAYIEGDDPVNLLNTDGYEQTLNVIDVKTKHIKEIVKSSDLQDENEESEYNTTTVISAVDGSIQGKRQMGTFGNICWSSTGKDLSFTYGVSSKNYVIGTSNTKINTYIVSFEN